MIQPPCWAGCICKDYLRTTSVGFFVATLSTWIAVVPHVGGERMMWGLNPKTYWFHLLWHAFYLVSSLLSICQFIWHVPWHAFEHILTQPLLALMSHSSLNRPTCFWAMERAKLVDNVLKVKQAKLQWWIPQTWRALNDHLDIKLKPSSGDGN